MYNCTIQTQLQEKQGKNSGQLSHRAVEQWKTKNGGIETEISAPGQQIEESKKAAKKGKNGCAS